MPTAKEQIESSPQYQTLTSFTQFLTGDAATRAELTSHITPTTPSTTISTYLETLWNSLLLIACQTEHTSLTHLKLTTFLGRLQTESFPDETSPPEYNDVPFSWSQLPDLNIYIRDWYNFSPPFTTSSSSSPLNGLTFEAKEWINFNAFLANLTKSSLTNTDPDVDTKPTDYSLYAIWSLRCLEVDAGTISQVDVADLQTAAVWIAIVGKEIYKLCKEERKYDGNLARGGDAYQDRGWKGFNMERWAIWEKAFEEALEIVQEGEDIKLIRSVRQAGVTMRLLATSEH
ncbi:hypothetical protein TWF281_002179 [Arthrobotrys megalospora]